MEGPVRLAPDGLSALWSALEGRGFRIVAPTIREGAVVLAEGVRPEELPRGWGDEQAPGRYRLRRRDDEACFGWAVGPHAWRRELQPPAERLWQARRGERGLEFVPQEVPSAPTAFIGLRGCDLAALAVQDRVLAQGPGADPRYAARRAAALLVAVECAAPAGTCFCTSWGTGPGVASGFDLALTEVLEGRVPWLLARAGSPAGEELLAALPGRPATPEEVQAAAASVAAAAAAIERRLDTRDLPALLQRTLESPRWDEVAARCLACANCTLVCPTCFCSTTEERGDLAGEQAERWRRWDSCFTLDFSYLHGGSVRASGRARYRQWLTHKLSTWVDQFGTSGCVGCGRCLTWCPVGIDITEEAAALRAEDERTHGDDR